MHTKLLSVAIAAALMTGCGTFSGGAPSANAGYVNGGGVSTADGCLRTGGWSDDAEGCGGDEEKMMSEKTMEAEEVADAAPPPPPPPPPPPAPAPAAVPEPASVEKVVLSGRALFPYDSAQLTSQGDREMSTLITKLQSYQDIELVDVVGHADSRGSVEYNQALSERRAETVKGKLEGSFPQVPITATGLGETAPIADNNTEEGRRLNRRVEIRVEAIN